MKFFDKITDIVSIALVPVLGLFVIVYIFIDFQYTMHGRTVDATIDSAAKEFSGFANSRTEGTEPTYRYRINYWFDADGERFYGEATISSDIAANAAKIPVQFIIDTPKKHRLLTPGFRIFRLFFYGCIMLIGAPMLLLFVQRTLKLESRM